MATIYELLSTFLFSLAVNLVPFAGPSNLLIAFETALIVEANPIIIGFLVALGSATAKLVHYLVTFFAGVFLDERQRRALEAVGQRFGRWQTLALFIVAATPLPDEPVVVPLGLMRYNPFKLYLTYLSGKMLITTFGAYLGRAGKDILRPIINQEFLTIISIVLTIVVTMAFLKIDLDKLARRVLTMGRSSMSRQ